MPVLVMCTDSDNSTELRKQSDVVHLEYIETIINDVLIAGPTSQTKENNFYGSVFVYSTDGVEQAKDLFFNDPFYRAGVYKEAHFRLFTAAAGTWIGDKIW